MKTLNVYHPAAFQNVLSDFDRYFESFFGDSLLAPKERIFYQMPAVDIQETDSAYSLDMDLPGYDDQSIDVHVDGMNLTIASRLVEEKKSEENQGAYMLRERKTNSFTRSFKLPENADPEAVNASFKNGVLNLAIKKRAEAQKRTIQINSV
ncbi:MAG: Hsp20/alpha crystallin family protein [Treponema sp.]|nr:Hsp20/alpha crystallin family protein [Treponema sp.]